MSTLNQLWQNESNGGVDLRKVSLFVLAFLLYNGVILYLGWNVYRFLHDAFHFDAPLLFSIAIVIIAYSVVLGRVSHKFDAFTVVGYYWLGFVQYGLMIFPLANLAIWLSDNRVTLIIEWVTAMIIIGIFVYGVYRAYSPVARKQKITIENDDRAGEEMRIVLASDFHLGPVMGKGQLEKFVRLSNKAKPDIVFLAGDMIDDVPYWYIKHNMKETMAKLTSNHGVYGILGNHEYYGRQVEETLHQMEQSNIRMLVDETIEIPGVAVVTGREDATKKSRKALDELRVESSLPWLIMDHTPSDIETPMTLGADLQVSGHTHLGQMWPNQWITKKTFPLDYGYLKNEQLHAITTSGFGFWGPPLRTNSRAEIWIIDIVFK